MKRTKDRPGKEALIPGFKWIIKDKGLLGGQPAVLGTRISVTHILECLAAEMSFDEISSEFGVPKEAFPDALKFAAQFMEEQHRVAS